MRHITYRVNISANRNFTERDVLFQIARIYVLLGLFGTVIAKETTFMEQLWLLKLEWIEKLPSHFINFKHFLALITHFFVLSLRNT